MSEVLSVAVLGPLQATVDGRAVAVRGHGPASVLAWLTLQGSSPVPVSGTAAALWPGVERDRARGRLRSAVSRLRGALVEAGLICPDGGRPLRVERAALHLGCEVRTDADAVAAAWGDALAALAAARSATAVALLERALEAWRGAAYPELGDTLDGVAEASRLATMRAAMDEALQVARLGAGQHQAAAAGLTRLTSADPERESAWRALMLALGAGGRVAEALRAYQRCREELATGGRVPSPATVEIEHDVLHHRVVDLVAFGVELAREHGVDPEDHPGGARLLFVSTAARPSPTERLRSAIGEEVRRVDVDAAADVSADGVGALRPLAVALDRAFGPAAAHAAAALARWPVGDDHSSPAEAARQRALRATIEVLDQLVIGPLCLVFHRVDLAEPALCGVLRHVVAALQRRPLTVAVTSAPRPVGPLRELLREAVIVD